MQPIEVTLGEWHRLHKELSRAQHRLAQAEAGGRLNEQALPELQAETVRLKHESDLALDALLAVITEAGASGWQSTLF